MLRCRFSPPYLCRQEPLNSSLAVYWPQYWRSSFSFALCRHPFCFSRSEIDVVSRITLPAWPGQGYGRHWLFFRALGSICILSILGIVSFSRWFGSLYWIFVFLNLWFIVVYIYYVGSILDYCVMVLLRFPPNESACWVPLNHFYAGLAGITKACIGPIWGCYT